MTQHNSFASQHADLDAFLFANIGTERNGMTLTVVSAISRLNEDPWNEARRLSTLPKAVAIDYLARTIARLPTSPWITGDATAIAARLVPLLPAPPSVAQPRSDHPSSAPSISPWKKMLPLYVALGMGVAINIVALHEHSAAPNHLVAQTKTRRVPVLGHPSTVPTKTPGAASK
jgi:hypothetical protein